MSTLVADFERIYPENRNQNFGNKLWYTSLLYTHFPKLNNSPCIIGISEDLPYFTAKFKKKPSYHIAKQCLLWQRFLFSFAFLVFLLLWLSLYRSNKIYCVPSDMVYTLYCKFRGMANILVGHVICLSYKTENMTIVASFIWQLQSWQSGIISWSWGLSKPIQYRYQ